MPAKNKMAKKVSIATVGLTPEILTDIAEKTGSREAPVMRVVGYVRTMEAGTTQLGPYIKFRGEFLGKNLIDGSELRAPDCVLPSLAEMLVRSAVEAAKRKDENAAVQFAIDVTVREFKSTFPGGYKYQYGVTALSDAPIEDALTTLMKEFGDPPMITDQTGGAKASGKGRPKK